MAGRIGHGAAAAGEAVGGAVDGQPVEDVLQDPLLRTAHVAVGRGEFARAAASLGHGESHVMRPRGRLVVIGQPAQPGYGNAQGGGHVAGRGQHRQTELLEFLDVGPPIGQPAGNAAAEEDDVGLFAARHGLGMEAFPLGRLLFLLLFEGLALGLLAGDRGVGHLAGLGEIGTNPVHFGADLVDMDQVLGASRPWVTMARSISSVRVSWSGGMKSRRPNQPPDARRRAGRPADRQDFGAGNGSELRGVQVRQAGRGPLGPGPSGRQNRGGDPRGGQNRPAHHASWIAPVHAAEEASRHLGREQGTTAVRTRAGNSEPHDRPWRARSSPPRKYL